MAFQVRVVNVDLIDTDGSKHNTLQQASAELEVTGSTAGVVLEVELNGETFTYSEGTEWSNAGSDSTNARRISSAINADRDSPIVAHWNEDATVTLLARKVGRYGEAITVERTAGSNVEINGGAGPENLEHGTGSTTGDNQLQLWLNNNVPDVGPDPGDRVEGSLIIKPLTTESSSLLVVWEEN